VSGRASHQIRRYGRHFAMLLMLIALGSACGFFILLNQRLPNPFQTFYGVNAAFPTAAGVVSGLGEPVNVAGVRVGQITATSLRDGQAVVHMEIDPTKIRHLYRNASAQLVPNTPLKDMQVDIAPGDPPPGILPSGATIPVGQTLSPIDSDELLAALDGDTRTWLASLLSSLGLGTAGRGPDLRALLRELGPTAAQLRQITALMAARRSELPSITHAFGRLTGEVSLRDAQLRTTIQAGEDAIGALAGQSSALRRSIVGLPETLRAARQTLGDVTGFARALGPTAVALVPTARSLPQTLRNSRTVFQGAALLPLQEIAPFVKASEPLTRALPPLAGNLRIEVPDLIKAFKVLAYSTNELAYNSGARNPGFLYWLAWFAHNSDSFISSSDANGPVWRTLLVTSCRGVSTLPIGPVLEQILGTSFGCR